MAAFANFRDFIGMDITSLVTLPVWIMEPYTLLQKVAEIMEYTDALEKAVETEDEFQRCVVVVVVVVVVFLFFIFGYFFFLVSHPLFLLALSLSLSLSLSSL